jgi:hypothetical protein
MLNVNHDKLEDSSCCISKPLGSNVRLDTEDQTCRTKYAIEGLQENKLTVFYAVLTGVHALPRYDIFPRNHCIS